VRSQDGAAFSVSRTVGDALPPELSHALLQAARDGAAPREVVVDREASETSLANWSRSTGVRFVAGAPWRWDEVDNAAFASAIDVLRRLRAQSRPAVAAPRFTVALGLLAAALVLHVIATLATFGWTEMQLANLARDLVPIARELGVSGATPRTAMADIARVHVEHRHRAGLAARNDAMPLLARAAPALAALPKGALRTATFNGGAWTLEFGPLDEATLAALVERLAAAGLAPLHARTNAGVRARISG
jgi:hypothetical protein